MVLNYSCSLAQEFAGEFSRDQRSIIRIGLSAYVRHVYLFFCFFLVWPTTRAINQRCRDHRASLFQPGGAKGSASGRTNGRAEGSSAHQ